MVVFWPVSVHLQNWGPWGKNQISFKDTIGCTTVDFVTLFQWRPLYINKPTACSSHSECCCWLMWKCHSLTRYLHLISFPQPRAQWQGWWCNQLKCFYGQWLSSARQAGSFITSPASLLRSGPGGNRPTDELSVQSTALSSPQFCIHVKELKSNSESHPQKPILLQGHERSITQIKYNREGDLLFSVAKDTVSSRLRFLSLHRRPLEFEFLILSH